MRWMICWNEEGGWATDHYEDKSDVLKDIVNRIGNANAEVRFGYREKALAWLFDASVGDVLEFPLGIVVRTSEHATEIDYDREETDELARLSDTDLAALRVDPLIVDNG